ncbi:ABC transporter permease subunit [Streptomyces diastatochromogenes]|nr:ABC transporter permease subunit [Streptomyces diastatochromogenes]
MTDARPVAAGFLPELRRALPGSPRAPRHGGGHGARRRARPGPRVRPRAALPVGTAAGAGRGPPRRGVLPGTSLYVQLFWLFFALPMVGFRLEPLACAVLALGLNYGAYGAEVVRGAVAAVPGPRPRRGSRSAWGRGCGCGGSSCRRRTP